MNLKEQKRLEDTWKALEVTLLERQSLETRSKFADDQIELLSKEIIDGNVTLCNGINVNFGGVKSFTFTGVRINIGIGEYKLNYYIGNLFKDSGAIFDRYPAFKHDIGNDIIVFLRIDEISNTVLDLMENLSNRKVLNYKSNKKLLSDTEFSPRDFLLDINANQWRYIGHELDHVYQHIIQSEGDPKDSLKQRDLPWNERHEELTAELTSRFSYFKKLLKAGNDIDEFWPNTNSGYEDIIINYFPNYYDTKGENRKRLLKRMYQLRQQLVKVQNVIKDRKNKVIINKGGKTKWLI